MRSTLPGCLATTASRGHSSKATSNFATRKAPRGLPSYAACYIGPGDALYIPCGVWHEVSSGGGLHAAANYWCHPPDGASFARPYTSSFWADDWARRRRDDPLLKT